MIGKCSECGRRRKLYHAIGETINALWCAECISKHKETITRVYEVEVCDFCPAYNGLFCKIGETPQTCFMTKPMRRAKAP